MAHLIANAGNDSNSFIDVAEANKFFEGRLYVEEWDALKEESITALRDRVPIPFSDILPDIPLTDIPESLPDELKASLRRSNEVIAAQNARNQEQRDENTAANAANAIIDTENAATTTANDIIIAKNTDNLNQKEKALIWASSIISRSYVWKGYKEEQYQKLAFPREGLHTIDGDYIDEHSIPPEIKSGTCEFALLLLQFDPTEDSPFDTAVESIRVGPMALKFSKDATLKNATLDLSGLPERISNIFSYYVKGGKSVAGFQVTVQRT